MQKTQTTTPTADDLVQFVQEEMFRAAVFYTEYFYRAKPVNTDCYLPSTTRSNRCNYVLLKQSCISYTLSTGTEYFFLAVVQFHMSGFKNKNTLC